MGPARAYETAEQAQNDPLAKQLFAIAHVVEVYYVDRYLTIVQDGKAPWNELERELAVPIRAADPAELQRAAAAHAMPRRDVEVSEADRARLDKINALLDERVRPALQMDGGGLEVLARVRADERTRKVPVVVLTSSREDADVAAAYRLGANSYIVKPVEFEAFMHAVGEVGLYWLLLNEPPR